MISYQQEIYQLISRIPKGKVLTYKIIASSFGLTNPRQVGKILHVNKDPINIPCHRVVRSSGTLVSNYAFGGIKSQKKKLLREGVKFSGRKINLNIYLWNQKSS